MVVRIFFIFFALSIFDGINSEANAEANPSNPLLKLAAEVDNSIGGRYVVLNGGSELRDDQTKLIWRRCEEHKIWDGKTCIGEHHNVSYDQAKRYANTMVGRGGWRMPTIEELETIFEKEKVNGLYINIEAFPNSNRVIWSSSFNQRQQNQAWNARFDERTTQSNVKHRNYCGVRLVRRAQ